MTDPYLLIRPAKAEDEQHALRLLRGFYGADWRADQIEPFMPEQPSKRFFLGIVDSQPVACAHAYIASNSDGVINDLYTDPEFRGRGIAPAIMKACEDWFISQGIMQARLSVDADNKAKKMYDNRDYRSCFNSLVGSLGGGTIAEKSTLTARAATAADWPAYNKLQHTNAAQIVVEEFIDHEHFSHYVTTGTTDERFFIFEKDSAVVGAAHILHVDGERNYKIENIEALHIDLRQPDMRAMADAGRLQEFMDVLSNCVAREGMDTSYLAILSVEKNPYFSARPLPIGQYIMRKSLTKNSDGDGPHFTL